MKGRYVMTVHHVTFSFVPVLWRGIKNSYSLLLIVIFFSLPAFALGGYVQNFDSWETMSGAMSSRTIFESNQFYGTVGSTRNIFLFPDQNFNWTVTGMGTETWYTYPNQTFGWNVGSTGTENWSVAMPGETDPAASGFYESGGAWYRDGKRVTYVGDVTEFRIINGKAFWKGGGGYYQNNLSTYNIACACYGNMGPITQSTGVSEFAVINGKAFWKYGGGYYQNNLSTYNIASASFGNMGPVTQPAGVSEFAVIDRLAFWKYGGDYYCNDLSRYIYASASFGNIGRVTQGDVTEFRVHGGKPYWQSNGSYYYNDLSMYTLATSIWGTVYRTTPPLPASDTADASLVPSAFGPHSATVNGSASGSGIVSAQEGNKFIANYSAYPIPQNGGSVSGISYSVTDDNPSVSTWISGGGVYASTSVSQPNSAVRTATDSGSGIVNATEGSKLIATFSASPQSISGGNITGVNYTITDDNPWVTTWVNGNQVYASIADSVVPVITNIQPNDTISTTTSIISADYFDTQSGIDPASATIHVDGNTIMSGCLATATNISCPMAGLSEGAHTIEVIVKDNVGNQGTGTGAFTVSLSPVVRDYYWTWYDNVSMSNWVLMANPAASGRTLDFSLIVEGVPQNLAPFAISGQPAGKVPEGMAITPKFDGLMGGPVRVISNTGERAIVSQRSLMGNSIEEVQGTDAEKLSDHFWWTWYDQKSPGFTNWILVANPGDADVYYEITIDGDDPGAGSKGIINPGKNVTPTFPDKRGGAVEVRAWTDDTKITPAKIIASQRVLSDYGKAFNEVPGIPAEELSDDYLWTWYDNVGSSGKDWVLIANPNDTQIYFEITVAGTDPGPGSKGFIDPGKNVAPTFPGAVGGPLEVRTWTDDTKSTPAKSIASQRVIWGPSFEEVPGFPVGTLTSNYHWTWYDQQSVGSTNWVLVANHNDASIYYEIIIGGEPAGTGASGTILAGENATPIFPTRMGGPVEVRAWTDDTKVTPAKVMASQRVLWNGYFNEVLGTVLD
ncbi:MAG: hypothetical protein HZB44_00935 [Actinobacteria bacterium]|nr:hypothetical protein [Actinomycetota bacterium]